MSAASSNSGNENKTFGGFQIIEQVGEGGMGIVYRAQQLSLNRAVALKILPPKLTADPTFVATFRKESLAAAMLHHPNLISVFDAGEADGMHYYAMEFVEGETLQQLLARVGTLPEATALQITACVANALKFGWDKAQLIHRDVKPANIMIGRDGNVKLCDLGLAKRFGENTMLSLSGVSYGTPHYVSPEQARGESQVDQRSDIYSLGMTIYHAMTGQIPFPASTAAAVMAKHLTEQLPDPREYVPDLSTGTCRLLEKMLGKEPHDRYQNWDSFLSDLQRVTAGQIPQATPPAPGKSTLHRNPKFEVRVAAATPQLTPYAATPKRSNYSNIITLIVASILVAAIVGVLYHKYKNPVVVNPPNTGANTTVSTSKAAAELLKNAELFAAANPDKTDEIIAAFRKIVTDHEKTPAAETARAHLARMAAKLFDAATEFADKNPNDLDGIIARFKRITAEFPDSPFAKTAQEQANRWQNERHARAESQRAIEQAEKFAKSNPRAFDQIISRLEKITQDFPNTDAAKQAQTLAEQWREKQRAFTEQQDAQRLAEERQREEEVRRRAEDESRQKDAQLRAEVGFVQFGRKYFTELQKRDYAAAVALAKNAMADAAFSPLRDRMQACLDAAQLLENFWSSLASQLAPLKGQEITLRGMSGKYDELTASGISLERRVGDTVASIEVPLDSITSAEWLALLNRGLEKAPAEKLLAFALFTFAEGRHDVVSFYMERAKKSGADVEPARAAITALQRIPHEEAALETLSDLRRFVEKSDWTGARNRLETLNSKFNASPVVQASRQELELLNGSVKKAEREIAEAEATRLFGELKRVVHNKQWNVAAEILGRLTTQYAQTDAMTKAAAELAPLKQNVDIMTGQAPSPDEDKDRRDMVKRRGGRMLIVNPNARGGERGPAGEPMYADFTQALADARNNDGIEVWDGLYKVGSSDKPLNNVLIYGKAGAMPVIQEKDPAGWFPRMFTVGEGVQLENLCVVGETFTGQGKVLFFRGQDNKSCTVRLRNCVVIGGGAFLFEGGNKSVVEIEDCVLLNFHRLIEFGRVATLRLQNSALVNFSRLFNASENAEVVLNLSINESVFANGILCEELPMRNGPWGGGWQGRRWQWRDWMRERDAQSVLRQKVTYKGDRNIVSNTSTVVFKVPGDELATYNDWRQIFFGQDVLSLDMDARNPLDIFSNATQGDFRLRPDTRAARIGVEGGSPGPRWQIWRWKAFQDNAVKYNLRLAAPR